MKVKAVFCLFVCKETSRMLLELRSNAVSNPNTYGLFGGGVDKNESLKEAMSREIYEETGRIVNTYDAKVKLGRVCIFVKLVNREFAPKLSHESAAYLWAHDFRNKNLHKRVKENIVEIEQILKNVRG